MMHILCLENQILIHENDLSRCVSQCFIKKMLGVHRKSEYSYISVCVLERIEMSRMKLVLHLLLHLLTELFTGPCCCTPILTHLITLLFFTRNTAVVLHLRSEDS